LDFPSVDVSASCAVESPAGGAAVVSVVVVVGGVALASVLGVGGEAIPGWVALGGEAPGAAASGAVVCAAATVASAAMAVPAIIKRYSLLSSLLSQFCAAIRAFGLIIKRVFGAVIP